MSTRSRHYPFVAQASTLAIEAVAVFGIFALFIAYWVATP